MKHEKNISPVGWYVVSYLLRFVELNDEKRDDEQARFLSWENTVLVRAGTLDEAYEKGMALALENAVPYKGGRMESLSSGSCWASPRCCLSTRSWRTARRSCGPSVRPEN